MVQRIRTALVSTFDKRGVAELCRELQALGIEILSSGGTAAHLQAAGVSVVRVSERTGAPEILGGRVKTLHPRIHGGILAIRSDPAHLEDLARHGIAPIDLVVVNLYPFRETASEQAAAPDRVIEMIDVGGPAMIRAAAKNHAWVGVLADPEDYPAALAEIRERGGLSDETRLRLAAKAFRHTADYDQAVHAWLAGRGRPGEAGFPEHLRVDFVKVQDLRYGENPHQKAAFYREPLIRASSLSGARQLQGKELSFNNLLDFDAALALVGDLREGACVIVKHGNPCGTALGDPPAVAFERALACDPVSAFGGVIAFNRKVDDGAARAIAEAFYEGVIAPDFEPGALEALSRKAQLRLLATGEVPAPGRAGWDLRRVDGGLLVQDWDAEGSPVREGKVVTRRAPTEEEWSALQLAWTVARRVKSNAIVLVSDRRTVGVGAGQMSRVDSVRLAVQKAGSAARGAALASDAFFPFRDGVDAAAEAGVTAVVQPGGSIRDRESIEAADEHGIAMVFTGRRHFRH
jgi:phosphoribosylaminoimidazolecarboxamide formyltransferase/IMP cyclohydrolase